MFSLYSVYILRWHANSANITEHSQQSKSAASFCLLDHTNEKPSMKSVIIDKSSPLENTISILKKLHKMCSCYQRCWSLLDIQNEFPYVASVMNSLHGLFYLRMKHSNALFQHVEVLWNNSLLNAAWGTIEISKPNWNWTNIEHGFIPAFLLIVNISLLKFIYVYVYCLLIFSV